MLLTSLMIAASAYATYKVVTRLAPTPDRDEDGPAIARPSPRPSTSASAAETDRTIRFLDTTYRSAASWVARLGPERADRRARIREVLGQPPDDQAATPIEIQANRSIVLASGTFVVATIGRLAWSPLLVFVAPGVGYQAVTFGRRAWRDWREERVIRDSAVRVILSGGMVLTGNLWTLALLQATYAFIDRILVLANDDSRAALAVAFGDLPSSAYVDRDGAVVQVALADIRGDDLILVRAGETIPVDGLVAHGVLVVDQHALTGESEPIERRIGEPVFAGTTVLAGDARLTVRCTGADTLVARIGELLERTTDYRTGNQLFCERVVDASIMPKLAIGAVTWGILGANSALATITCSFGAQMRFTGPLCIRTYLRDLAERGVLVKDARALERARAVDVVVFDKTGTLTETRPRVLAIHPEGDISERHLLRLAAAAEVRQSHPIAEAILRAADAAGIDVVAGAEPECIVGHGVTAQVGGSRVTVGSARFLRDSGCWPGDEVVERLGIGPGTTRVHVAVDASFVGTIELAARPRPEARRVVADLRAAGIEVQILSGDNDAATRAVAETLGADGYVAGVLPHEKADFVARLQSEGHRVCFVGDGINDAIALKLAHVSISIRGATTAALDTAQVVLSDVDLRHVVDYLVVARAFDRAMRRNLLLSLVPAGVNLGSVYMLGTGVLVASAFSWVGILAGAVNASQTPPARVIEQRKTPDRPVDPSGVSAHGLVRPPAGPQLEEASAVASRS